MYNAVLQADDATPGLYVAAVKTYAPAPRVYNAAPMVYNAAQRVYNAAERVCDAAGRRVDLGGRRFIKETRGYNPYPRVHIPAATRYHAADPDITVQRNGVTLRPFCYAH